jgi:hypothetical protein
LSSSGDEDDDVVQTQRGDFQEEEDLDWNTEDEENAAREAEAEANARAQRERQRQDEMIGFDVDEIASDTESSEFSDPEPLDSPNIPKQRQAPIQTMLIRRYIPPTSTEAVMEGFKQQGTAVHNQQRSVLNANTGPKVPWPPEVRDSDFTTPGRQIQRLGRPTED